MIRVCSEFEKEIIKNSKSDVISDTIPEKTSKTVISYIIGTGLGFMIAIPVAFAVKSTDKYLIEFIILFILSLSIGITHFFIKGKAGSRLGKKSLAGNISINGATIIGINPKQKFIIFVEDDLNDFHGRPYRISVPAKDFTGVNPGDRILVVYVENGPYYIMKLNDQTRMLIPQYSNFHINNISYNNSWYPTILPHPNAIFTDVMPRDMTQTEKEEFVNTFYKFKTKNSKEAFLGLFVVMFLICGLISLVLFLSNELSKEFLVIIACIFLGLIAFFMLLFLVVKKSTLKSLNKINHIRRVIMNNNSTVFMGYIPQQNMSVYYNAVNEFPVFNVSYPMMTEKFYYGDILYMYQRGEQNYFIKVK